MRKPHLFGGGFSWPDLTIKLGKNWEIDFLSSTGVGKSCVLPIQMPNPSPTLDKNLASMGPGILSSVGVGVWRKAPEAFPGVWRKAPEAFPDSNATMDTFQSAKN